MLAPGRPAARRRDRLRRRWIQRDRHLPRLHRRSRRATHRLRGGRRRCRDRAARGHVHRRNARGVPGLVLLSAAGRRRPDHRIPFDLSRFGLPGRRSGARVPQGHSAAPSTGRSPTPRRWTRSGCCAGWRASSRPSSPRTRSPGAVELAPRARTRRRSSWSTCPAAATRTSRPRRKLVRPARRSGAGRLMTVQHSPPGRLGRIFDACRARGPRSAHRLSADRLSRRGDLDRRDGRWSSPVCDIIEVGVPYSDPGMDGPVIATATEVALQAGVRVARHPAGRRGDQRRRRQCRGDDVLEPGAALRRRRVRA